MESAVILRPLAEQDGPALAGLSYSSPDGGRIQYAANYQIDAVQAVRALHGNLEGIAATARDTSRLIGVGLVRFGSCQFEGACRPYALISNLIVHPDYRGKGLASLLAQRQLALARERTGPDGVILANYQHGNQATARLFSRHLPATVGPMAYLPLPTLPRPPAPLPGMSTGPLDEAEYEAFTHYLNDFYQEYNFHQPETAECLAELCQRTPFNSPFRHAYAAVDSRGNLLAGLLAMEEYRLKEMEIRNLPPSLRLVNRLKSYLPENGAIREVYLDHLWFRPGQARAARHLVDTVRWIWASRANYTAVFIDPRGQLSEIFPTRPWSVMARSQVAVQGPTEITPARYLCPIY